jgi:single-strand DNA-binding protein
MSNFNESILLGNLTADPELHHTTGGTSIANKSGDREETLFMQCVAFGKLAEIVIKYTQKGKKVLVSGRLVQENWETDEGAKRSKIKLYVNQLRLLGSPNTADTPEPKEEF